MAEIWTCDRPLLLASTSATRRALLEAAGLPVETAASDVDEREIERDARAAPVALALRLASAKALAVSNRHPDRIVLGADQVLDLGGAVLHKPADRAAARHNLRRLRGRTHVLRSACALARGGTVIDRFVASASLTMRALSDESIERYLDQVGPSALSGAGIYQVESLGIHLFDTLEGDHSTVLGLPLIPLLERLRGLGCLAF